MHIVMANTAQPTRRKAVWKPAYFRQSTIAGDGL